MSCYQELPKCYFISGMLCSDPPTVSLTNLFKSRARSHNGVMDYDEACFMHLTPGVVHNFPKAVGV